MNKPLALLLPALLVLVAMTGCRTSAFKGTYLEDTAVDDAPEVTINEVTAAYQQGDYKAAYTNGRLIALDTFNDDRYEAAYITGLSAEKLGNVSEAEKYLAKALKTKEPTLRVDASAALGLVYSQQGRYKAAMDQLLWAAPQLKGERQAQAYYYAGLAQKKLDQDSQARTTLMLAHGISRDETLRAEIMRQIRVTGWTLQLGAYSERSRALTQAESVAQKAVNLSLGVPRLVPGTTAEGKSVTFVHVGEFSSYQSARRYRDALDTPGVIIRSLP